MNRNKPFNVSCIVGARPNFMKMAPIIKAMNEHGNFTPRLIHTGQHYDVEMNSVFFQQLGLPDPNHNLGVGSGTQTEQTAHIMIGLEKDFISHRPDFVLVVGDVNSTVAAALVAAKMGISLAHVEAGLRSFDRNMPEEINRLITDRLSDILFTTERTANRQLEKEGVLPEAIHFVGNVMIDTLIANLDKAIPIHTTLLENNISQEKIKRFEQDYALVTLHRPSNVDEPDQLKGLLRVLNDLSERIPLVFTMHPRTKARIQSAGLENAINRPGFIALPPLSYFEMMGAMRNAVVVITDSGGLQEETTVLGVPCLTVRENTERPITICEGTNILVGASAKALENELNNFFKDGPKTGSVPEFWDGKASQRIASVLDEFLSDR